MSLEQPVLDLGNHKVIKIVDGPRDVFSWIFINPEDDYNNPHPKVLVGEHSWSSILRMAVEKDPYYNFMDVPANAVIPELWSPSAELIADVGYERMVDRMQNRTGAIAYWGDWDLVQIVLMWDFYKDVVSLVLSPVQFMERMQDALSERSTREELRHLLDRIDEATEGSDDR